MFENTLDSVHYTLSRILALFIRRYYTVISMPLSSKKIHKCVYACISEQEVQA